MSPQSSDNKVTVLVFMLLLQKITSQCDPGWIHKFGRCFRYYQLSSNSINYAKLQCESRGAALVTVNNEEENAFIASLRHSSSVSVALGARDDKREGVWLWPDGMPVGIYSKWTSDAPNPPNDGGDFQDCLEQFHDDNVFKWNDYPCGWAKEFGYMCQKSPDVPATVRYNWLKKRSSGEKSTFEPLTSVNVVGEMDCAVLCLGKSNCLSFNLCRVDGLHACDLLAADMADALVPDGNCDHYYLQMRELA